MIHGLAATLRRVAFSVVGLLANFAAAATAPAQPNVVILLSDDLGWADLGCYGSTFHETPHLDQLAREGMRFTNYYTAGSICSPTRASLMTGKYPVRTGITDYIPGLKDPPNARVVTTPTKKVLATSEFTFARAFKAAGYRTFYTGKWHLGPSDGGLKAYGWDDYVGDVGGDQEGEAAPAKKGNRAENLKHRRDSTARFTQATLDFLQQHGRAQPFVLMLSYHDVHTPIQPMPGVVERFMDKRKKLGADLPAIAEHDGLTRPRQDNAEYASMVTAVDDSVARVRQKLAELGLAENTIVIFASDNGGLATHKNPGPTNNSPLRSGKGWLYEGGIRAPFIVYAPGVTRAGTRTEVPAISTDLYPTLLALAHLPPRPEQHLDGLSLAPLLGGGAAPLRDTLYWHYPHYHGSTWAPGAALRDGDWKLIEFYHYRNVELYNLRTDPSETRDLTAANPAKTTELLAKLHAWQQATGAIMPRPNPALTP
ncbi:MAG: sulfatase [Opitutaceae bacterium]